jgi:hypothetical protein
MNGVRACLFGLLAVLLSDVPATAQGLVVNGYTYIAPSVYPAPPVVVSDPALVVPTQTVIQPLNYAPVVYAPPVYASPAWRPAPVVVAPTAVRERAWYSRNGLEYKYQAYVPGRAAPVYTYRVDPDRYRVKIRERFR